ncbi:BspA family leucine-rich repeat surface protein [Mycoplasma mycoides]|uniref:BspA family leucine-rich repeat surface protein n=2 Tax=Mycoplasma mycoides TaxID=2102 RepID=A0AB38GDN1_MYCMC|nr:BspA family leucine-rich repeat surface protein [Mycoplasma mycoides]ADH21729.1 conserved hypothetical protein [synthetic Mycoplasma mycoides JCVI-syn1.0]ACU78389.1 conserved hypothetical protein [Mycoplasma mycoides subsp. capri str. GM12]ACU79218.1 conserved hypothetical protein [Mycoplasma mycoides subsp. capri str. GM12]SRX60918.1 BspA family leucine-rich repeat surface protein [Mycoplasma mycoides subsp. capri]SRX61178.1 BspA family leucine-rich repeat surface protein [Mycoplasma mycoi
MRKFISLILFCSVISISFFISLLFNNANNYKFYLNQKEKEEKKEEYPYHKYNGSDKSEITEIGYYKNESGVIIIRPIPWYVKKVTETLPEKIQSLRSAFAYRYDHHKEVTGFEKWDTKNITDMSFMFFNNETINVDLSNWKTEKVTNMQGMFKGAIKFNNADKPLSWTTNEVTNMDSMFDGAKSFKQNLKDWNVDKVDKNRNFSRASGISNDKNKLPKWKKDEEQDPIEKKIEKKEPEVIIHPSPTPKPKIEVPLTKIITPISKSSSTPNSKLNKENLKPNITTPKQETKKLSTPAIVGIVVGSQVVLTSLAAGVPYLIKRFKK